MGSLLTSILNTANALQVFSREMQVTENNVTNASTPGYVKQTLIPEPLPFDLTQGLTGGVLAGPVVSSRSQFAEQSVREQQSALGYYTPQASDLSALENNFDLSSSSGISATLNSFFQTFSQLSINPNDTVSRQAVIDQAGNLAQAFRDTATGLFTQANDVSTETQTDITQINSLAQTIAQINAKGRTDPSGGVDAGVDAELNSSLEGLSQYVGITVLPQQDGTVNVYLGGQTPLVISDQALAIQGDFSTPQTAIFDSQGKDITSQVSEGQLAGVVNLKNTLIPSYVSDLNTLAQNVADQVNTALDAGIDQNGGAPITDLFTYDPNNGAALTLSVNNLTPDQIAAALPGAPAGNGNALALSALGSAHNINGYTYTQFYGNLAGRVGQDSSSAQSNQNTQQQLLAQSKSMRSRLSSVSLDEEAAKLISYEQAYTATSKMLGILNSLTDTLLNMVGTASG